MNPSEFNLENGTLLGCGAIAFVNRCKHTPSGNYFAVKSVSKIQALQQGKTEGLRQERAVLTKFSSFYPGIAHLFGTTQSVDEIYFIMENLSRGDLMEHIKRVSGFRRMNGPASVASGDKNNNEKYFCITKRDTQKIIIQVILSLKLLWENNFVHRDVKPENIAFHDNGRAVLIDFDTVLVDAPKLITGKNNLPLTWSLKQQQEEQSEEENNDGPMKISQIQEMRKKSQAFCGTAQFVSPETLNNCDWTFASDLFAVGSLIYFMLAGKPIFDGPNTFSVLGKIKQGVEKIPIEHWNESVRNCPGAVSLIRKLLSEDPRERFCCKKVTAENVHYYSFDLESFKNHEFFADEEAQKLWTRFEQEHESFMSNENIKNDETSSVPYRLAHPSQTPCSKARGVVYHDEPKHDDEYGQYALKAGASDIERWWHDAIESVASSVAGNDDEKNDQEEEDQRQQQPEEDDDENDNVIDDVGQQQFISSQQAFSSGRNNDDDSSDNADDEDEN